MRRLLVIAASMNTGGAETFLMKVYRKLDREKFQMDFCVGVKEEGFYDKEIRSLGGKVIYACPKTQGFRQYKKDLSRVVREGGYQVVLKLGDSGIHFLDLAIAKKAGAKRCIFRSCNAPQNPSKKQLFLHRTMKMLWEKYIDVKIAPSDLAAKYTFGEKEFEKGLVFPLHNAVDLNIFRFDKETRDRVRKDLGIDESTLVIGNVARLVPQKNHTFLIDIFSEVIKREENAILLLCGTGSREAAIREKAKSLGIAEKLRFLGVRRDIPDLLCAMDLFLLPSFFEGMPNTVIEAQAVGLNCLISDTITREANVAGRVHYLPLSESAAVWAEKLLSLDRSHADTHHDYRKNAYDIDSCAKEFTRLCFGEEQ